MVKSAYVYFSVAGYRWKCHFKKAVRYKYSVDFFDEEVTW